MLSESLSSYSSFNPASSYISYGITPLKLSSMYGEPSSSHQQETDLNNNLQQSLTAYTSSQPTSSYKAMPFGTEVKISSIYELPSESAEASSSNYGSPSEVSNGYGFSLQATSNDSPSESISLYGSPSPPSSSSYASPAETPSTSLDPPSPLAESYVSPPGESSSADREPFSLETYVPDEPTAPVLDPRKSPAYKSDVVITTEKVDKKENAVDRVGLEENTKEDKKDLEKVETSVEDVEEGEDTTDDPVLLTVGEDEEKSVAVVETSKAKSQMEVVTEKDVSAHLVTEREVTKEQAKEEVKIDGDVTEQGHENAKENKIEGTENLV